MLAYLVTQERKDEIGKWDADFKNMLLANNPELYQRLFGEELSSIDDADIEYMRPSDTEFRQMMADLKESGVLDATPASSADGQKEARSETSGGQ